MSNNQANSQKKEGVTVNKLHQEAPPSCQFKTLMFGMNSNVLDLFTLAMFRPSITSLLIYEKVRQLPALVKVAVENLAS